MHIILTTSFLWLWNKRVKRNYPPGAAIPNASEVRLPTAVVATYATAWMGTDRFPGDPFTLWPNTGQIVPQPPRLVCEKNLNSTKVRMIKPKLGTLCLCDPSLPYLLNPQRTLNLGRAKGPNTERTR